jgi:hypothetical protein
MDQSEEKLLKYITPFKNVPSYLKALLIVSMLFSAKNPNYEYINHYFDKEFNTHFTRKVVKIFVDDVILYKYLSSLEFISSIPKYKKQIHLYGIEKDIPTKTIDVDIQSCTFCNNTTQHWFDYINPRFYKLPTLYERTQLSMI